MKKRQTIVLVLVAAVLAISLAACGSTPQAPAAKAPAAKALNGVPDFVNEAYLGASEDVLIGIGAYRIGNDPSRITSGKTFAETRVRADISRQLVSFVRNMVDDYFAQSEVDESTAVSFQENITRALSQSTLQGSRTIKMNTQDGVLWVVMEYGKSFAIKEYSAAEANAKLKTSAAANFQGQAKMETEFNKLGGGGPVPVTE